MLKKNYSSVLCIFTGIFLSCQLARAQYKSSLDGQKSGSSYVLGQCYISEITAKYSISTIVGQPSIFVNIKWRNGSNSSDDCLKDERFDIFVKIYSNNGGEYYIPANGSIGLIPKGNNTWGSNPLPGSPDFDELFVRGPLYKNSNTNDWNYVPEEMAKSIWRYGFSVSAIVLKDKGSSGQTVQISR